jgi:hypothetical protein
MTDIRLIVEEHMFWLQRIFAFALTNSKIEST